MNSATGGNIIYKFLADTKDLDSSIKQTNGILKGLGAAAGTMAAGIFAAGATATAALIGITKESVQAYANLEQSLGGVETLFKENADKVIKNAKQAYKTAGVDANTYMEGVTSFAASLLQSTGNDTAKAADIADMAFRDMSDNANKFGSDMASIQVAYQGFAKQNYTMLDNLKLGYGGTKTEMERLLADAQKLSGVEYNIDNLSDVYSAIHVIQEELGVTGTTASEAGETITGSITAAKAAWQNFLSGAGGIEEVIETVVTAGTQIGKAVTRMLPQIVDGIVGLVNGLIPELPRLIELLLPTVLNGAISLIQGLISIAPTFITMLSEMLPSIIQSLVDMFVQVANAFGEQAPTIMPIVVNAIIDALIALFENIDVIIDACLALILGLTEGMIQSLPILLDRLPEITEKILTSLIEAAPVLAKAGIELIIMLGRGIIQAIPTIIKSLWTLSTQTIPNAIKEAVPKALQAGKDIIKGLWNGIKNFDLVGSMKKLANKALDGFKSMLGIHSPSTAFAYLGKMSMLGYTNQIESMKGMLDDVIQSTFSISPELTSGDLHYSPNVVVNNNITSSTDPLGQTVTNIKTFANGAKNDYNYGMGV